MLPTKTFVYQKCLKKGEIVEEAVKEELTKLCVNLYKTFPCLPCDLSLPKKLRKIGLPQNADGCDFSMTEIMQSRC